MAVNCRHALLVSGVGRIRHLDHGLVQGFAVRIGADAGLVSAETPEARIDMLERVRLAPRPRRSDAGPVVIGHVLDDRLVSIAVASALVRRCWRQRRVRSRNDRSGRVVAHWPAGLELGSLGLGVPLDSTLLLSPLDGIRQITIHACACPSRQQEERREQPRHCRSAHFRPQCISGGEAATRCERSQNLPCARQAASIRLRYSRRSAWHLARFGSFELHTVSQASGQARHSSPAP